MLKGRHRNVSPNDYFWEQLCSIMSRDEETPPTLYSHFPHQMRSGQSTGPLKYFICDACGRGEHSTTTFMPWCYGRLSEREY